MKSILSLIMIISCLPFMANAVDLVKDGQPVADIITKESPQPSIALAAQELQNHLEKISGAKLPIVDKASPEMKNHIYVGESDETRKLGVKLDDVKYDGFKIIASDNYVVLAGKELDIVAPLLGKYSDPNPRIRNEMWQELTGGKNWRMPLLNDVRGFQFGIHVDDGTGTLYSVYELLEQLGMRWYLPMADIGIVYPSLKNVSIKNQNLKKEPQFPVRQFNNGMGRFKDEFLWYKFMKLGTSMNFPQLHSVEWVMNDRKRTPAEYFGKIKGKINYAIPVLTNEGLRKETVDFLEKMLEAYPKLEYLPIGMPDGWIDMDDTDAKKWKRSDSWGEFSDYSWDFIMDIRSRIKAKHPDMKFTTFAYSLHKLVPNNVEKIPDDTAVSFCQNSTLWMLPQFRKDLEVREDWIKKLGNGNIIVYDYYFDHAPVRNFPPLPVIFTKYMEENFRGMYGRCKLGFWVDTSWHTGDEYKWARSTLRRPGISHLMVYLHNRFAWDDKLDMQKVLNEYYDLFFGPASAEMKEFYEFSEAVWSRPVSHNSLAGWLEKPDVDKYFDILKRAKAKAGDSIYAKRIDLISSEMESLHNLFAGLECKGPNINGWKRDYTPKPEINGDLEKPFWTEREATFKQQGFGIYYPLREMFTGITPKHVSTTVSFRWINDNSALIIGVECMEPKMDKLKEDCKERDSTAILSDDNIQIYIGTPQGLKPWIVVNPNGTVYDECITSNVADLPTFYTVKNIAVKKYEDRWTAEIQVDTKPLGADVPSGFMPWSINVYRQRMAGNTPEHYMLNPSGTELKETSSMCNLIIR